MTKIVITVEDIGNPPRGLHLHITPTRIDLADMTAAEEVALAMYQVAQEVIVGLGAQPLTDSGAQH